MPPYEKIKQVKDQYTADLMKKANVVGVGIGLIQRGSVQTEELAIIVLVRKKLPRKRLKTEDIIPHEIEGVPIDVQAVGDIEALD